MAHTDPTEYVVDGDGHVCEPADLWERNLPDHLKDQALRLRWNEDSGYDVCLIEDRVATDRGLVGLGNAGETYDDFGRGRHYEELNPAGFDPLERIKVLDSEGIDLSVMYPGCPACRADTSGAARGGSARCTRSHPGALATLVAGAISADRAVARGVRAVHAFGHGQGNAWCAAGSVCRYGGRIVDANAGLPVPPDGGLFDHDRRGSLISRRGCR